MQHIWLIDVLADLRAFSRQNGLPALAGQLDEALMTAALEIAQEGDAGLTEYQATGCAVH
jgi:hypothetical protein